jgi:hypothetical protein
MPFFSDDAFDEVYKSAGLGAPFARAALSPAMPTTTFFLVLQGVQAIRHRKSKTATPSNSVADYGMHELEFEPRNLREKWLLRIVYWGTILLVTFMLWEYVKTR